MSAITPWVTSIKDIFDDDTLTALFVKKCTAYTVKVQCVYNTLWIVIEPPKGCRVLLRAAYSPADELQIIKVEKRKDDVTIRLQASIGSFSVRLEMPKNNDAVIRYTTTLRPSEPMLVPFWPRDMVITDAKGNPENSKGEVHISQVGTRSGLQFISLDKPKSGTLLYMQNLTALNDYCQATETSLADVVGGQWPELGFALPQTKEKPVPAGKEIVISDAFVALNPDHTKDELKLAELFLDMLATIYLALPKPDTEYHDWLTILDKGLHDLENSHGCWSHGGGHDYLNAYICDYETPPELMVQLAVLLPLLDYKDWSKKDTACIDTIRSGLGAFYDKKLGTVVRWLPSQQKNLDGKEEQLQPNVMDSWYLHHPMINLCRMAIRGDKDAKKLFLESLPFSIKVARHFKYKWPVFYNMETLEVIKAETQPGKGGEKDVAGLYTHLMMQAWELTKEKKYLTEAKRAAKTLLGKGFELFYQANNTAFSAKALLRLYKEINDPQHLQLSYVCLANIIRNTHIWECMYGYAKDYNTFFGIFPLNDAPYTAAYEEQEVFASMHDYLIQAEGLDIPQSISLLLAEFVRYVVQRAAYYYPPNLPKEALSTKPKTGELDPNLWIAVEDIHDGWEQSGQVGQEVYGAGVAFGIVPRYYYQVPGEPFMIYADYPTSQFVCRGHSATFNVKGDERLTCRVMIVKTDKRKLPAITLTAKNGPKKELLKGTLRNDGHVEYTVPGGRKIEVKW